MQSQARDFSMFSLDNKACYNRKTEPSTFVVDAHVHFQPFGGAALPFDEMLGFLQKQEIYFVNIYGIGQKLPPKSPCTYYLDCPGTTVTPSISNDFVNASNIAKRMPDKLPKNLHLTLSMSFTNLAEPQTIVPQIDLLDKEFPGMFSWMGEINVVKQAIFPNGHFATPREEIEKWKDFMQIMEARNIPVSFHSDLGNDQEPTKYLPLMQEILQSYPGNIIVWHHLGLSKELSNFSPKTHIGILTNLLDKHPNLYLDISWRVLYDNYFSTAKKRKLYIEFFEKYPNRILPGTDFVAAANKTYEVYQEEVKVNSDILKSLNNEAFRDIALGQNYFNLLALPYKAPKICE
ncbi:MAG: amidohydrolase family protein [Gallionellaceae bacterium]